MAKIGACCPSASGSVLDRRAAQVLTQARAPARRALRLRRFPRRTRRDRRTVGSTEERMGICGSNAWAGLKLPS